MSILEDKIQLAKMVLDIEDESLIEQIKGLLLNQEENFDDVPFQVKEDLKVSLIQAENKEFISYQEVFKEVDALLKK